MKTFFYCALIFWTAAISSAPTHAAETNSCCTPKNKAEATAPHSDKSLYQLDSKWTTDDGKQITLGTLAGRPQVVTMFFASCQLACPILGLDMRKIEAALPDGLRTNVGFVLISFDTERDTPAALAKYRAARHIPAHWKLLTASPDDVFELAALLGVKFKKESTGQFAHSNLITILNADGEIAFQQTGLNRDPAQAFAAISALKH